MVLTRNKLKSWQNYCFLFSAILFVCVLISFPCVYSEIFFKEEKFQIFNTKILAKHNLKEPTSHIIIYKNNIKSFIAPCLKDKAILCDTKEDFLYPRKVLKITGIKYTPSKLVIGEIYFSDGSYYLNEDVVAMRKWIHFNRLKIIRMMASFCMVSLVFFILGFVFKKLRRELWQEAKGGLPEQLTN